MHRLVRAAAVAALLAGSLPASPASAVIPVPADADIRGMQDAADERAIGAYQAADAPYDSVEPLAALPRAPVPRFDTGLGIVGSMGDPLVPTGPARSRSAPEIGAGSDRSSESGDWSIVPSPNTSNSQPTNFLSGVTCLSATDCFAVGHSYVRGVPQTLTERWDGTSWTIVPSPNTSATLSNVLSGVSCTSTSDCWAVGYQNSGTTLQTLIERWDGRAWSIVASANTSTTRSNILSGVTCVSASDCWAVGYHHQGSDSQTLIERWDGTSWSIVASANTSPTTNNFLSGVTCVSASDCWAVGSSGGSDSQSVNTTIHQTLIERWNGTAWSMVASPNSAPVQSNLLFGVTCVSSSDCWAVGNSYSDTPAATVIQQTLIARWNGASWSIAASPNTSRVHHNSLRSVTCTSADDCWAVGYAKTGGLGIGGVQTAKIVEQTLIEHWDGASWSITASPNTDPGQNNVLYGVTCLPGADCWAVGYADSGGSQTLTERWNGEEWSIVASPNVEAFHPSNHLHDVTCVTATQCWAVGYYFNGSVWRTLIERWNGSSWTIVASPNTGAGQDNLLTDVTCVTASDCWAVGYSTMGELYRTLIQRWNGSSWTIVASPNTGAERNNLLSGVTCLSPSECWAVGTSGISDTGPSVYQSLIERWDGTSWAIVASANTNPAQNDVLHRVACVSASDCWAVGMSYAGSIRQTLVEHWDGTSWTVVASPNHSATNLLTDVSCVSTSDCWAVGHSNVSGTNQTLVEHWDGTSWSIVTSANTGPTQGNYLFGVTCASASDCWAVGYSFSGVTQNLIQRWDGNSWSVVTSPNNSATHNNLLLGVTCASASDCWAVGYHHNGVRYQTLVLRYTGAPAPTGSDART